MIGFQLQKSEDVLIHFPRAYMGYLSKNPLKAQTWVHKVNFSTEDFLWDKNPILCKFSESVQIFVFEPVQ